MNIAPSINSLVRIKGQERVYCVKAVAESKGRSLALIYYYDEDNALVQTNEDVNNLEYVVSKDVAREAILELKEAFIEAMTSLLMPPLKALNRLLEWFQNRR